MKYFLKIDGLTGHHSRGPLGNADIPFFSKHKTWLGRILAELNALKRRRDISINSRWEIAFGYHLTASWLSGFWNKVLFATEILRGDYSYTTSDNWRFRCQIAGTYLVNASISLNVTNIQTASLGLFKNGVLYSRMRNLQSRIYDSQLPVPIWHYNPIIDLAGGFDQVYLNPGDQIEIRVYYVAETPSAEIFSKIVGYVNVALVGNNKEQLTATTDNW